jgi:hypothetical protein
VTLNLASFFLFGNFSEIGYHKVKAYHVIGFYNSHVDAVIQRDFGGFCVCGMFTMYAAIGLLIVLVMIC